VVDNTPPPVDPVTPDKPPVVVKQPVNPPPVDPVVVKNPPVNYVPPTPRVRTPKLVAVKSRTINPWADVDPGTWYRIRTVRNGQVSYTDTGLKEKGKDYAVVLTQTSTGGPATETRTTPSTAYLRGEEEFTFESQTFLCEIRTPSLEDTATKTWALLAGKNQGAVIKSVGPQGTFSASRVWEHTLKVKGTTLECLVVEGQVQKGYRKQWFCTAVPLTVIRQESDDESFALIDLGTDWSKRPAFPK
jgi:hypothetical protein